MKSAVLGTAALAAGLVLASAPANALTIDPQPTGLDYVFGASRTGRYVLGEPLNQRLRLVDLESDTVIVRLPRKAAKPSVSGNGRLVAYTLPLDEWGQSKVMVFDRRTGRTREVTRKSNGSLLRPSWRSRCTLALCEEDQKLRYSPQLTGGQISGNGRFVVFAANFAQRNRVDVYVKNLRNGVLQRFTGAGRLLVAEGDTDYVQAPSVSTDGNTILIPGRLEAYEASDTWSPGRAIFNRSSVVDIGGVGNSMTRDGRTITINGVFAGTSEGIPPEVAWYDVATATSVPASPTQLRLTLTNSSADGRYALWKPDLASKLRIRDRTLGVDYDLYGALVAAGFGVTETAGAPGSFLWGYPDRQAVMSGDGRVAFVATDQGIQAVRWTP
ncbi:MAG: hypothetical protein MUD05_01430 [Candidatus Nanopelagicales bacterium]|nr:hypothetical protein [Candidatus Nanopelagicales bacterium]